MQSPYKSKKLNSVTLKKRKVEMAGACAYISTFFLRPKREKVGKMGGKAGEVLLKVPYKDTPINTTIKNIF